MVEHGPDDARAAAGRAGAPVAGEQRGEDAAVAAYRWARPDALSGKPAHDPGRSPLLRVPDLSATVRLAKAGDEDAFRVVYRAVQPGLAEYVRSLVGAGADEVTAEVWQQISHAIWAFEGGGDEFRGWVAGLARERALDRLRRSAPPRPVPATATEAALLRRAMGLTAQSAQRITGDAGETTDTSTPAP